MSTAIEQAIAAWVKAGSGLATGQVIWAQQAGPRPATPYIALRISDETPIGHDWADVVETPLVVADDLVESVDATANTLTLTAHGLLTGDGPIYFTTTGTLPGGLAVLTGYWIIKVTANTIKLATSLVNATAGTAIDLTTAGTGAHTLVDSADTERKGAELTMTARGVREATLSMQAFGGDPTGTGTAMKLLSGVLAALALPARKEALSAAGVGIGRRNPVQSIDGIVGAVTFEPRASLEVRFFLTSEVSELGTYIESAEVENETTGDDFTVP